jgi:processive 1,2-diacylglycerol beta-glucosyltransferase
LPYRVVVVYSRVGGGHLSAARAIARELDSTGRCAVKMIDAYLECGRFPVTLFPAAYAQLARHHPQLWSMIYRGSSIGLDPKFVLGPFLRHGFRRGLAECVPDVVISVLPVVNGLLAEAASHIGTRLEVVLTDWHSVHRFWVARGVHQYTAPTDSARDDCIRSGAAPNAVDVVGIPVGREFAADVERRAIREWRLPEVGLDADRFTVLAMVGAEGSPRALRNIVRLAAVDRDLQLLVVCGHNAELRQQVQRLRARIPVKALGFVDNIFDLMRSADVLVTKAGGLTLAEAFASRVPVVVHDVLPGQEAGNLEYVLKRGAVVFAPDARALVRVVETLCLDPVRRAELATRGARLARPQAARQIALNVIARLDASVEPLDASSAQLGRDG